MLKSSTSLMGVRPKNASPVWYKLTTIRMLNGLSYDSLNGCQGSLSTIRRTDDSR